MSTPSSVYGTSIVIHCLSTPLMIRRSTLSIFISVSVFFDLHVSLGADNQPTVPKVRYPEHRWRCATNKANALFFFDPKHSL